MPTFEEVQEKLVLCGASRALTYVWKSRGNIPLEWRVKVAREGFFTLTDLDNIEFPEKNDA